METFRHHKQRPPKFTNQYRVKNHVTGEMVDSAATTPEDVLGFYGWTREDCSILFLGRVPITAQDKVYARDETAKMTPEEYQKARP